MTKTDTNATTPLSEESEAAAMSLGAVYIDTYATTYWKDTVRITLGETSYTGDEYWRFAMVMQKDDVKRLIKRLQKIVTALEKPDPEEE